VKSEVENTEDWIRWQLIRFFRIMGDVIETEPDIDMSLDHLEVDDEARRGNLVNFGRKMALESG
jgi:hypothetical protein